MSNPIYRSAYNADQIEAAIDKGPRVNSAGYWEVWNIANMAYESTGVGAGVKPPTVVTQASQMTNHGYIYIYNGSEDGYTPGYWYYWDGSAWTAGGAYQVAATDPTLSVAGAAADAKATGELKNAITGGIDSLTVTEGYNHSEVGVYAEEYEGIIKMYGTPTSARKITCFNGNDKISSSVTSFVKTLDAGTYTISVNVSGYQPAFVVTATYTTFANVFVVANNDNPNVTVTFNAPVMLAINANPNRNYGTSENPTYVTVTAEKITAVDIVAREELQSKLGYERLLNNTDDIDEILEPGVYRWTMSSVPQNSPTVYAATLLVIGASGAVSQFIVNGNSYMYARYFGDAAWTDWNTLSSAEIMKYKGVLSGDVDFNDVTSMGMYQTVQIPKGTADNHNRPSVFAGILVSIPVTNAARLAQIYINALNYIFTRIRISGTWTYWRQVGESSKNTVTNSWGVANTLALMSHVLNVKWTPVGNMPKTTKNGDNSNPMVFFDKVEQTGLPYSSVRDQDKAVGMDVSIHTFMTAVHDPKSVLYTRCSTVSNASTYYGTVCSGLPNYSYGINLDLTNYFLGETEELFDTIPMIAIRPGDMIWVSGHCAMIQDINTDEYGRINKVVVAEEWRPVPRVVTYNSWNAFMAGREGYIARRYKYIDGVPYKAIQYVQCFDEVESEIVYPDVQTEFGDAAVFMVGEDVKVNVIDKKDYTTITVTHDGTAVLTTSDIEDFTIENVTAGLYAITASNGTEESVSTFFVVDATGSFDTSTGEVAFSSTNATPVMVNVYNLPSNRRITCKPIILTDADREAGHINVLDYMDADYQYAKVTFMTPYGTAVWYSETHQKWIPIS